MLIGGNEKHGVRWGYHGFTLDMLGDSSDRGILYEKGKTESTASALNATSTSNMSVYSAICKSLMSHCWQAIVCQCE